MTRKPLNKVDGRKVRTHAAIMAAAGELFMELGFARTTVEQIAERAGVSVGSVYVHFQNKEHLQQALITEAMDINDRFIDEAQQADSPLARVLGTGDAYLRFAIEHTVAFRCVAMRPVEPVSEAATRADEMISERVAVILAAVAADLELAIEIGEIEPLSIPDAIAFLWGAWSGVAGLILRQDSLAIDPDHAKRALELGASVLLKGARPMSAPPAERADAG